MAAAMVEDDYCAISSCRMIPDVDFSTQAQDRLPVNWKLELP
jgi:hypothetical protein